MKHVCKMHYVLFLVVAVFSLAARSAAQSAVSQLSGTVKDGSGAYVADAEVQIKNVDTNAVRALQTDSSGSFTFPSLAVGHYTLQVKKQGFSTYIQSGIVLDINSNPNIVIGLQVGSVTQEVEIQANASMVESHDTGVTQVINPQEVVDLPLNGRQVTDLIALSGAAVNAGTGGTINTLDYPTAVSYSVAGSAPNATNYYLDGAQNMDYRTDVGLPMPFPDALSEFSVGISAMPANLGAHPGGSVNGVTRSGTNSFHGSAFEFVRNGILDATARTYPNINNVVLAGVRDTLVRNQFGGTFGGPVRRNKIFFFGGYQGTRSNSTAGSNTTTVPTVAMRKGDFSAALVAGSGCTGAGTFLKTAFTTAPNSNIIQPALLQTPSALLAAAVDAFTPLPTNASDPCGNYSYQGAPTITSEDQGVGRADWQRTANDSIFGRYYFAHYTQPSLYTAGNVFSSSGVGLADLVQTVAIGDTHIIGTHGINTFRLAFDRTATQRASNPAIPTLCSLGMNATCPVANQFSAVRSAPGNLGYDFENSYGVSDGFAWTNGKHQINVGFLFENIQMNNDGLFQENPSPTFSTATTGNATADFLTGNADGFTQGNGQLGRDGQKQPSAYIQDAWKVSSRIQLTGGVRWDPFIPQHNKYSEESDFTLDGYINGTLSTVYPGAPPGITFPGDKGFNGKSPTNAHYGAFAPRIGVVWDVTGNGTQTLRAGYGVFYDTTILWNTMHIVLNPPWGETLSFTPLAQGVVGTNYVNGVASGTCTGGLINPYCGQTTGNPFPFPLNPPSNFVFPTNGVYVFERQDNEPTNVQQWNLAYQKQFGRNLKLSATYIGNKTSHEWLGKSLNSAQFLPQYGTTLPCTLQYGTATLTYPICNSPSQIPETQSGITNVTARRALARINPTIGPKLSGGLSVSSSDYNAAYNGLLISIEKRLSQGFSVLTNYTWARCMDVGEIGQDIGNTFSNPNNPQMDWGNCGYNRKGAYNLSLTGQSPKYQEHWLQHLAGSWNGSAIFTASTGSNYSEVIGYDFSLTGVGQDRPNKVGDPNKGGQVAANPSCVAPTSVHNTRNWYNPCAFMAAPYGTYGQERRNSEVGPANWNLNLAVWRTFTLPEHVKLDFRAEAFNALNHTQIGNPSATVLTSGSATVVSPSAGIITSGAAPRIMQLAVKVNF